MKPKPPLKPLYFPFLIRKQHPGSYVGEVPGLPLSYVAPVESLVERELMKLLRKYVIDHPDQGEPPVAIKTAIVHRYVTKKPFITVFGPAALVRSKSPALRAAARNNGKLGGRPRLYAPRELLTAVVATPNPDGLNNAMQEVKKRSE